MIHAIRLGTHAEKEYLLRAARWFDELVLNANLLEGTAGASAVFVLALGKNYMVDPVTYAFGQNPSFLMNASGQRPKRTFVALSARFGEVVQDCLSHFRSVEPSDLQTPAAVEDLSSHVLDYQRTRILDALQDNEVFLEPGFEEMPPARLIAPYFHNDEDHTWLQTNRQLATASLHLAGPPEQVWIPVVFDSLMLDRPEDRDRIVESYEPLEAGGFLLWPTDFNETRATAGQIDGLKDLARRLCAGGKPAMSMYGGYFTALLREEGLQGISHGVGYGERRDVVPVVGGGLPPAKYYFPPIHDHISMTDLLNLARTLDEATFRTEICACTVCTGLIQRGGLQAFAEEMGAVEERPYGKGYRFLPTARVYRLTRFHYIEAKHTELGQIENRPRDWLASQLSHGFHAYADFLGRARLGYLLRWAQALGPA